eukprot:6204217-Pleurochrysis_carterae.AAC.2
MTGRPSARLRRRGRRKGGGAASEQAPGGGDGHLGASGRWRGGSKKGCFTGQRVGGEANKGTP